MPCWDTRCSSVCDRVSPMSSESVISVRNLTKSFATEADGLAALSHALWSRPAEGAQTVLQDISFDIRRGEAFGIIGRNGAGKSTLLKLVCGVMKPSSGTVNRSGRLAALLELGAAFHPDFTGRENARFVAGVLGLKDCEFDAVVGKIAEFADIGAFFDRKVQEYSSGMYARLAFAVNLHCAPDILVIDEALAVGDILFQVKCFSRLHRFRAEGGTLVIVSHDEAAMRALCDRVLWLDRGRLLALGAADHVCNLYHGSTAVAQAGAEPALDPAPITGPDETDMDTGRNAVHDASRFDPDLLADPLHKGSIAGLRCWQDMANPGLLEGGNETHVLLRYLGPELPGMKACFMLRDRLAQIVFGACVPLSRNSDDMQLEAEFCFDLPCLVSGEYVVEALVVIVADDGGRKLVDRAPPLPLEVRTSHISHGLANLRMREISINPVPVRFSEAG